MSILAIVGLVVALAVAGAVIWVVIAMSAVAATKYDLRGER